MKGNRLTDIEQEDGHQHSKVDKGEQDKNPESDGRDEVRCDFVDESTSKGKGNSSQCDTLCTTSKREDLGGVYPAV